MHQPWLGKFDASFCPDFAGFEETHQVVNRVLQSAKRIQGDGFGNLKEVDIISLVNTGNQELGDNELMELAHEEETSPADKDDHRDEDNVTQEMLPYPQLTSKNTGGLMSFISQVKAKSQQWIQILNKENV